MYPVNWVSGVEDAATDPDVWQAAHEAAYLHGTTVEEVQAYFGLPPTMTPELLDILGVELP